MATYTSTRTGDWDDAATWGGSGTPSGTGDIANIASGHTVTFDQALVNQIGDVNINTGELGMPLGTYEIDTLLDNSLLDTMGFELTDNGRGRGRNS